MGKLVLHPQPPLWLEGALKFHLHRCGFPSQSFELPLKLCSQAHRHERIVPAIRYVLRPQSGRHASAMSGVRDESRFFVAYEDLN
jgi:hypothetical protein